MVIDVGDLCIEDVFDMLFVFTVFFVPVCVLSKDEQGVGHWSSDPSPVLQGDDEIRRFEWRTRCGSCLRVHIEPA